VSESATGLIWNFAVYTGSETIYSGTHYFIF